MEEELNENDLEERLYALIHHVDETQASESVQPSQDAGPRVDEARSTVRRYWRSSCNGIYQKTNTPKDAAPTNNTPATVNKTAIVNKTATINKVATTTPAAKPSEATPKQEKNNTPASLPPSDLLILKNTIPQNYEKSVEILEIDAVPNVVELETSDEDEVIEVALPPKPTITIESSDEDEMIVKRKKTCNDKPTKQAFKENKSPNNVNKSNRDVSASPVPSVVSSMSDEFIRGDCLALNISSAQPDNESFDFSLHGADLLGDGTPSKRKKKKKTKDRLTSTPIVAETTIEPKILDNIFATPKSKAKNKKQKKSYAVTEKSIPNADVYDSDSNQSVIDINKNHDAYVVTEKSFPSADVYESDSSVIESIKDMAKAPGQLSNRIDLVDNSDSNMSMDLTNTHTEQTFRKNQSDNTLVIDLSNDYTITEGTRIEENIVIGNVSGFTESNDYGDESLTDLSAGNPKELGRFGSTKVPQILFEDLDFDNLKGKDKVCRRRRYSLTTLRAEMEKFYNESWGGENFNHQELQKNMSRDKSLWVIDPKDRMPNPPKRKVTCNFCNRPGHRDDLCRYKPPICYMCGLTGHYEPRCPRKICFNCGAPNFVYSTMCRNCSSWGRLTCAECGQPGHPASHCPDIWRRYHNTIDENMPMESSQLKPQHQLFCSGCARRGHLVHTCRSYVPFCTLPIPVPHVARYWRLYPATPKQDDTVTSVSSPNTDRHKRLSKSPTAHETHVNKKRISESTEDRQRKTSQSKEADNAKPPSKEHIKTVIEETIRLAKEVEKAPDYIPISSSNHDKKGHVIQDNEVSDTSDVMTSSRIFATSEVFERLHTEEGQSWLKDCMDKLKVNVQASDSHSFFTIKGTVGDQEAFQSELREWTRGTNEQDAASGDGPGTPRDAESNQEVVYNIPRKKNEILRTLSIAFDSLKQNIGDPKALYKELLYLQNHHDFLLHQKVVSSVKLNNNRDHINMIMKKLNMVLLGQAGLAEGTKHLTQLYTLQEKVVKFQFRWVPNKVRKAIGQHYQNIFTAMPRDDYAELLKKFYVGKRPAVLKKMNKSHGQINKNDKSFQQQKQPFGQDKQKQINIPNVDNRKVRLRTARREGLKKELVFCRKKLLKAQTNDNIRNKKRLELVNQLHRHISCLTEQEVMNKKKRRKMKKTQEQAQMFLTDVK